MSFASRFLADPKPVVTRRGYCDFKVEGTRKQVRAAFEAHKCDRPRPTSTKRRPSGFALRAKP
jgi:hypothetical protein